MELYDEGGLSVLVAVIWSREVVGSLVAIAADALGCAARMAGSGGVGVIFAEAVRIFNQAPYEHLYVNCNPTAVKYVCAKQLNWKLGLHNWVGHVPRLVNAHCCEHGPAQSADRGD